MTVTIKTMWINWTEKKFIKGPTLERLKVCSRKQTAINNTWHYKDDMLFEFLEVYISLITHNLKDVLLSNFKFLSIWIRLAIWNVILTALGWGFFTKDCIELQRMSPLFCICSEKNNFFILLETDGSHSKDGTSRSKIITSRCILT